MAKKTRAELKEDLKAAKEEMKAARLELREFEKSNSLEKDTDHSTNAKVGKKWSKMNDLLTKKRTGVETLQASYDAAKPEKVEKVSKYEYPKGTETAADKKKFRAAARAAAKKAAKGDAPAKAAKKGSSKKGATEEATETTGEKKVSKAERKALKKAGKTSTSED